MPRIIEKELSYRITGLCFKTHQKLGRFARERQYADDLEQRLLDESIQYLREPELKKIYNDSPKGNRPDFVIENRVIADLKAKPYITKDDYYQMQRYLEAADLELGLIINFRAYKLAPKRVLNSKHSGHLDKNSDN